MVIEAAVAVGQSKVDRALQGGDQIATSFSLQLLKLGFLPQNVAQVSGECREFIPVILW